MAQGKQRFTSTLNLEWLNLANKKGYDVSTPKARALLWSEQSGQSASVYEQGKYSIEDWERAIATMRTNEPDRKE